MARAKARSGGRGTEAGWVELRVRMGQRVAEMAIEALMELGSRGVWVRRGPGAGSRDGRCELAAYFTRGCDPNEVAEDLGRRFGSPVEVEAFLVPDEDWATQWRKHFRPSVLAPGLSVAPPRARVPVAGASGARIVRILPGMAFGTGTHATTRMCARWLAGSAARRRSAWDLLDVGTGSGILAIAARLGGGARRALAIDRDPVAIREAAENVRRNGLSAIDLVVGGPEAVRGCFQVVVANLTGPALVRLAPSLARLVAPRGRLIVSGFLETERQEVERAMGRSGLDAAGRSRVGEWGSSVLRARPPIRPGGRPARGRRRGLRS